MAVDPSFAVTVSLRDRSGEPTSFSINIPESAMADGDTDTEFDALMTATIALINGIITRESFTRTHRVSNARHASAGQREEKFLVTYEDSVTRVPYKFELPCRDTTLIPPVDTDEYDITASPFAAWVTAFQAYAVSPDGNPVVVDSIRLMGKNS